MLEPVACSLEILSRGGYDPCSVVLKPNAWNDASHVQPFIDSFALTGKAYRDNRERRTVVGFGAIAVARLARHWASSCSRKGKYARDSPLLKRKCLGTLCAITRLLAEGGVDAFTCAASTALRILLLGAASIPKECVNELLDRGAVAVELYALFCHHVGAVPGAGAADSRNAHRWRGGQGAHARSRSARARGKKKTRLTLFLTLRAAVALRAPLRRVSTMKRAAAAAEGPSKAAAVDPRGVGKPELARKPGEARIPKRKLALLLSYRGTQYHGLQRQTDPSLKTIEGEMRVALAKAGAVSPENAEDLSKIGSVSYTHLTLPTKA